MAGRSMPLPAINERWRCAAASAAAAASALGRCKLCGPRSAEPGCVPQDPAANAEVAAAAAAAEAPAVEGPSLNCCSSGSATGLGPCRTAEPAGSAAGPAGSSEVVRREDRSTLGALELAAEQADASTAALPGTPSDDSCRFTDAMRAR